MAPKITRHHIDFFLCICKLYILPLRLSPLIAAALYSCPRIIRSPWVWLGYKRLWLLSWVLSRSDGSQGLCCKLPHGEALEARNWGRTPVNRYWGIEPLTPTTCAELNPANSHVRELRSGFPFEPSVGTVVLADSITAVSWEIMSQPGLARPRFQTHGNSEMVHVCCFKLLSIGVVCYAAIEN